MTYYVIKKTTTVVSNNTILGEANKICKIFEDKEFADNYYKKYLNEPKIYSESKKVFFTFTQPEEMELDDEEIATLKEQDPYLRVYLKETNG